MAIYSYTKLADYILDQLWGFASVNSLKNSLRYIAEDILGDPSINSDAVVTSATSSNNIINAYTRTTGTSVGKRGVAISGSSGSYSRIANTTYQDVTNLSVTITTSGRPVYICLTPVSGAADSFVGPDKSTVNSVSVVHGYLKLLRDAVDLGSFEYLLGFPASTSTNYGVYAGPGSVQYVDTPTAGTYVYKLQAKTDAESRMLVNDCQLVAFEL